MSKVREEVKQAIKKLGFHEQVVGRDGNFVIVESEVNILLRMIQEKPALTNQAVDLLARLLQDKDSIRYTIEKLGELAKLRADLADRIFDLVSPLIDNNGRAVTDTLGEVVIQKPALAEKVLNLMEALLNEYLPPKVATLKVLGKIASVKQNLIEKVLELVIPLTKDKDVDVKGETIEVLSKIMDQKPSLAPRILDIIISYITDRDLSTSRFSASAFDMLTKLVVKAPELIDKVLATLKPFIAKHNLGYDEKKKEGLAADALKKMVAAKPALSDKILDFIILMLPATDYIEVVLAEILTNIAEANPKLADKIFSNIVINTNGGLIYKYNGLLALERLVKVKPDLSDQVFALIKGQRLSSEELKTLGTLVSVKATLADKVLELIRSFFVASSQWHKSEDIESAASTLEIIISARPQLAEQVLEIVTPLVKNRDNKHPKLLVKLVTAKPELLYKMSELFETLLNSKNQTIKELVVKALGQVALAKPELLSRISELFEILFNSRDQEIKELVLEELGAVSIARPQAIGQVLTLFSSLLNDRSKPEIKISIIKVLSRVTLSKPELALKIWEFFKPLIGKNSSDLSCVGLAVSDIDGVVKKHPQLAEQALTLVVPLTGNNNIDFRKVAWQKLSAIITLQPKLAGQALELIDPLLFTGNGDRLVDEIAEFFATLAVSKTPSNPFIPSSTVRLPIDLKAIKQAFGEETIEKLRQRAKDGVWTGGEKSLFAQNKSCDQFFEEEYLKTKLKKARIDTTPEVVDGTRVLLFIHMCEAVANANYPRLACIQGFAEQYPSLVTKLAQEYPNYLVNQQLANAVIKDQELRKIVIEKLKESVTGRGYNHNNQEGVSSYWHEYSQKGMEDVLELRFKATDINKDKVKIIYPDAGVIFNDTNTLVNDLVPKVDKAFKQGIVKAITPVNLYGKHWVGMTVELAKDDKTINTSGNSSKIIVTYINPEGTPILKSLSDGLKVELARLYPDASIEITEKEVPPQKYNNCGLEVIENLIAAIAGEASRIDQEEALDVHSILYVQSLILEEASRGKVVQEEKAKNQDTAGSRASNIPAKHYEKLETVTEAMDQVWEDTQNSNTNELDQWLAMAKQEDSKAELESMDDAWNQTKVHTSGLIQKLPKITDPKEVVKEASILTTQSSDRPIEQQPVELKKSQSHIGQQTQVAPSYEVPKVFTGMGETLWKSAVQCLHTFVQVDPYEAPGVMRSALHAGGCAAPTRASHYSLSPELRETLSQNQSTNRYDATKQPALLSFSNLFDEAQSDGKRNAASFELKPLDNTLSDIPLSAFRSMAGGNTSSESWLQQFEMKEVDLSGKDGVS